MTDNDKLEQENARRKEVKMVNTRFKFRIFEYKTREMIELDAVGYSSFDPFHEGKSRLIMIPSGLYNTFHYDKQCLYDNEKFSEPMQCTGLKDKNGALIYEGDIVQILGDEIPYIIEFEQDRAMFIIHSEIDRVCGNFDNYSGSELEVIGNIYEGGQVC